PTDGRPRTVALPPRHTVPVVFAGTRPYPLNDRALGAVIFPAEPLPPGMTSPDAAVDDNPATAWQPGPGGRLVVDLGAPLPIATAELAWTAGRVPATVVETSTDGVVYTEAARPDRKRTVSVALTEPVRYLAVRTLDWRPGDASLTRVSALTPPN
ncbi:discoidin domain-containing protein, partial [Amycolatopsis sp. NPDC000740]